MSLLYTASFKEFGSLVCLWHDVKLRKIIFFRNVSNCWLNSRVYRQRGFSLRSKGAHEIMWRWHVKIQNMAKFSRKIAFPIGTRGHKGSNFPKMSYISRSSPVVQKLEQLEQNRKKHVKAHSAGYRRLHIGFELKSVFKDLEVIKGKISFYLKLVFRE